MTNSGNEAVVEIRDVTKTYRQGAVDVHALRGLTMEIRRGEFTAICGPSGSGKTTTLNVIGALDTPTSGTVWVEGHDLGALSRKALSHLRRDRIGFVAERIINGEADRGVAHATSGPCLQQNLVAVLEA